MAERDDDLIDVAAAVADGAAVDWRALEAGATTPEARDRIRRLEVLAGIGRLKADQTYPRPDESRLHESILHPRVQSPATFDDAPVPVTWGPLTIVEKIGRGTFGDVYRAREARLDRDVALKLLRHRDAASSASSDVIEEARLMARVRHPNVTTIYGAERIDGRVGLWMEFVTGRTLEDELTARGPFGADELRRVGQEMASALSAVHRAGLLHRDVKAHNVLRAADGRLMLTDFGTGRPLSGQSGDLVDELAGSPLYLAPEVLAGAPATVHSDLYSLGVLLHRLATGSFPVQGKTLQDLRDAHATGRRTRLRDVRGDLPAGLVSAIDRATSADPSSRPATADDLAASLAPAAPMVGRRRAALVWASLAAVTVIVGVWTWTAVGDGQPASAASGALEETIVGGKNAESMTAVSPDGRLLAYIDPTTGNLGVQSLETGARRLLTSSASWDKGSYADSAVFSRDSRRLAYGWARTLKDEFHYEVRVIDIDHPEERAPLYTHPDAAWLAPLDWSPDGRRVVVIFERDMVSDIALLDADAKGAVPQIIKSLNWRGSSNVKFSPDGRYLAYDATPDLTTAQRDVFVVSADGHETHAILTGPGDDSVAGWPNASTVLIASDRRGSMSLWRQPMRGTAADGAPDLLKADIREETLGVTSDGRLFYRIATSDDAISVATVDLQTGARTKPLATAIVSGLFNHRIPTWSPDGQSFAYISSTSRNSPTLPTQRILSIQSPTGLARIMPVKLARWYMSSWASDSRSVLAFALDFNRHVGIFRVDTASGAVEPLIVDHDDVYSWLPQWAKDGRYFYYLRGPDAWTSSIETEFIERDVVTGNDRVVFRNRELKRPDGTPAPSLRDWMVSPDGRHIAGLETNGAHHALWVAPLGSHTVREIYRVAASDCAVPITHFAMLWTPDSRALIVNAAAGCKPATRELRVVPIAGGQAVVKLDIDGARLMNDPPAVSPNGQQVAFRTGDPPVYEIRALKVGTARR
jgi:serine/threonine-protein kinase